MSILTDRDTGLESGLVAYAIPRVNLLPDEVHDARRLRTTKMVLGGVMTLVLGGVAAGYLVFASQAADAQKDLETEQARTAALRTEQTKYAEVPRVLAQVDSARTAQETAMATDVLWYRYLNDLALTYPGEVWIDSFTASVGSSDVAAPETNPLATAGVGTISVTGTALSHSDVASWLDVLDGTAGFTDARFTSSSRTSIEDQTVVEYSTEAVVTDDALSHRFDRKAS